MTHIEHQLTDTLKSMGVNEPDRIILGTFNDNPYVATESGKPLYSAALYEHMEFKGYENFVTETSPSTRMDTELNSVIDHILVNKSAKKHIQGDDHAVAWLPNGGVNEYPAWRKTYSDHFPVRIKFRVSYDDDPDS